jgi:hypothetical protein
MSSSCVILVIKEMIRDEDIYANSTQFRVFDKTAKLVFDIGKTEDPIYVLLPGSSEYIPLNEEIHSNIMNEKYRF